MTIILTLFGECPVSNDTQTVLDSLPVTLHQIPGLFSELAYISY